MPENTYKPDLKISPDFDWKTIEAKKISLTQISSVLNEKGDTVASFLPPGDYDINVGKSTKLTVVPSLVLQTKAGEGSIKQRVYFPAQGKYATVMFEDLFPAKGDMDMNDIVFGLNIEFELDNQARVSVINFNIQPRGVGSSYESIGLAADLYPLGINGPDIADLVKKITHTSENKLSNLFNVDYGPKWYSEELDNNRCQVIPLTANFRSYFPGASELFVNVRNIDPAIATTSFTVSVELKSVSYPYSMFSLLETPKDGKISIDIFAVVESRDKEIHFKGQLPTDKFSTAYFAYTRPMSDFSTIDNWVWAIISDQSIRYPQEFVKIYNAYPNFKVWAESSGSTGVGWYSPSVIDSLYTKTNYDYIN